MSGASRERKVAAEERANGAIWKGTGDAHGKIDGIRLKRGERPRVVQVKGTSGGPFERFGPLERAELEQEAEAAGWPEAVDLFLAWAPPDRRPTRWIPAEEWPSR